MSNWGGKRAGAGRPRTIIERRFQIGAPLEVSRQSGIGEWLKEERGTVLGAEPPYLLAVRLENGDLLMFRYPADYDGGDDE